MKWNFLYQISAASRTPDWGPTAPRSPFSPSSVLNWICWNPLHPEQNSWLRHWMDVQLCCNIYIVKCNWLVQCYMCSTWMSKYWNWDWSNYCEGESCSRESTIVRTFQLLKNQCFLPLAALNYCCVLQMAEQYSLPFSRSLHIIRMRTAHRAQRPSIECFYLLLLELT